MSKNKNSSSENTRKFLHSENTQKPNVTTIAILSCKILASIAILAILVHRNTKIKNFEALLEENKLTIRIEEIFLNSVK